MIIQNTSGNLQAAINQLYHKSDGYFRLKAVFIHQFGAAGLSYRGAVTEAFSNSLCSISLPTHLCVIGTNDILIRFDTRRVR